MREINTADSRERPQIRREVDRQARWMNTEPLVICTEVDLRMTGPGPKGPVPSAPELC